MPHLFCFGLGYSAMALAGRLKAKGWRVTGTVRSADKAAALRAEGIGVYQFDGSAPLSDPAAAFAGVDHMLLSVPPTSRSAKDAGGEGGDPVLRHHGRDLQAMAKQLAWAGYLSTTGVYGDHGGDWVDETTPLAPTTDRGEARRKAEAGWTVLYKLDDLPLHIFRLAGIYGPGRNQIASLRAGTARRIDKPGQVFSRIHVEDIAGVLEASIAKPNPLRAYNVCDDEPAPPAEVVAYAAELIGAAPPPLVPFEEAAKDMSPMAKSFYAESKRCSNRRIKDELGVSLLYPTYREGLQALAALGE